MVIHAKIIRVLIRNSWSLLRRVVLNHRVMASKKKEGAKTGNVFMAQATVLQYWLWTYSIFPSRLTS